MSPICPCCNSADTVGYWDIKANQGRDLSTLVMKEHYPNARICVDCNYLWWREPFVLPDLATIGKAKP